MFSGKRSNNFFNGFTLGIFACVVVAGLILASWMNSNFWQQQHELIALGVSSSEIRSLLFDNVTIISFSVLAVIWGGYSLVITAFSQFSPTINSLVNSKKMNRTRRGTSLLLGGVVAVSYPIISSFNTIYLGEANNFFWVWDIFVVAGAVLIVLGCLLLVSSYFKSRNLATRFKEQNQSYLKGNSEQS
jgi:hypothetical protein